MNNAINNSVKEANSAAEKLISYAIVEGAEYLNFNQPEFRNLDTLPGSISNVKKLNTLNLSNTKVRDISALAYCPNLENLSISSTKVSNLIPLINSYKLRWLSIEKTNVNSIEALKNIPYIKELVLKGSQVISIEPLVQANNLIHLDVSNSSVNDMRPLLRIMNLNQSPAPMVLFKGAAMCDHSPELSDCAIMQDSKIRFWHMLSYLETLPPFPEPLPWLQSTTDKEMKEELDWEPKEFDEIPKVLSFSKTQTLLENNFPELKERCQAVFSHIDDALAYHNLRIPNEKRLLEEHRHIEQSLVFAKALIAGIHTSLPEKIENQEILDEDVRLLQRAFNGAVSKLQDASLYIDQVNHTPTFGGLLKLGCASAIGGVLGMLPGVNAAAAIPAVYGCLYGKEAAKSLVGIVKPSE